MKNYVFKTLIYLSFTIIAACGDDDGSKTFVTRTQPGGGSGKAATTSLTVEQKTENTLKALEIAKNSLSEMILNTSSEVFSEFSNEYGQLWMYEQVNSIEIPDSLVNENTDSLDNNNDNEEKSSDKMFEFNEGALVLTQDFLMHFNATDFSSNPLLSVRKIKLSLLKHIHTHLLSKFSDITDEDTSQNWAVSVLEEGIGKDNLICIQDDLVLTVNKPTGLARVTSLASEGSDAEEAKSVFVSPELFENSEDKDLLFEKLVQISDPSVSSTIHDGLNDNITERLFLIGSPIPNAENDETEREFYASDDSREIVSTITRNSQGRAGFVSVLDEANSEPKESKFISCDSSLVVISSEGIIGDEEESAIQPEDENTDLDEEDTDSVEQEEEKGPESRAFGKDEPNQ